MLRILIAIAVIFFTTSCSMPETKVYSLYIQLEKSEITKRVDSSIVIRIDSPRYLAQPYITYRVSPYQMEIARYSKWESSPKNMVMEAFKESLILNGLFKDVRALNIVPKGFYIMEIHLKRFERLDEGKESFGELLFDVSLLSPEYKVLYKDRISRKVKLEDKTFVSLAKMLSSELNKAIYEVIRNIGQVI